MGNKRLWVSEADFDEQGSFCDTDSGHEYMNNDNFTSSVAVNTASDNGTEVVIVDGLSPDDSYGTDQRFNHWHCEKDDQDMETPTKYGPGR